MTYDTATTSMHQYNPILLAPWESVDGIQL